MIYSEHSRSATTSDLSGRVVVVIDDNDRRRNLYTLGLEAAGLTVTQAATLLDVQRCVRHTQPGALVVDMQRSETDGLCALKLVRARQDLRDVPIVFLSSCDAEDFRWQVLLAGADVFGLRPIGIIDLQTQLVRLLRSGRPVIKRESVARPATRPRALQPTGSRTTTLASLPGTTITR